jgi:hypothetical protein
MPVLCGTLSAILDSVHLPGRCNEAADALSRNNLPLFLQLVPTADRVPTPILKSVLEALIYKTPEWWSPAWATALHTILTSIIFYEDIPVGRQPIPQVLPSAESYASASLSGLCSFVSYLADEGLKLRYIKTYPSGIRFYHGLPDPFQGAQLPCLEYVTKGVKRHQARVGGDSCMRLPIMPSLLRELRRV